MGIQGLKQTALMLTAAICGVGSSVAYFGVAGSHAMAASPMSEFVRIALPSAVGIEPAADTMIAQIAPSHSSEDTTGQEVELAAVGIPLPAISEVTSTGGAPETAIFPQREFLPEPRMPTSLAAVRYDLAGGAMSSNAIQTEKKIHVDGAAQARIKVRIDENSAIYLDAAALSALMPSSRIPPSETGFVSFDQLRSEGVGVRYDAALDTIQLNPDGA